MTTTYKILGQVNSTANAEVNVYTVPLATQASISSIVITNIDSVGASFSLSFVPSADAGHASQSKHFAIYNKSIQAGETQEITGGITLSAGDVIRITSSTANLIANVYGGEIS